MYSALQYGDDIVIHFLTANHDVLLLSSLGLIQSDVVEGSCCMPSDLIFTLLTDVVLAEFPHTSASDVRAAIRRKCNNEHFSKKN